MNDAGTDQAARYLLGQMGEEEREAFERRFLDDPELSETIAATEADLLDDYLGNELDPERRRLVEEHMLRTAAQRERLRAARALQSRLARPARRRPPAWWMFAAAAAGVVIAFLLQQRPRSSPPPAAPPVARVTPPQVPAQPSVKPPGPDPIVPATPVPESVATLVLAAATTRSEDTHVFRLPSGTTKVRIEVPIDPAEPYSLYRAIVQSVDGEPVAERANLKRSRSGVIALELAAPHLSRGDYEVLVEGIPESGAPEPVGSYAVRIE